MRKIYAPWNAAQVAGLEAHQDNDMVHPYTSMAGNVLIPTREGWRETSDGPVVQTWAWDPLPLGKVDAAKEADGERILALMDEVRGVTRSSRPDDSEVRMTMGELRALVSVIENLAWATYEEDAYGDRADAVRALAEDIYLELPQTAVQRDANGRRVRAS